MSGFVAIINLDERPVDLQLLQKLTHYLSSRGPDKQSTHIMGGLGMGHALFRTTNESEYEHQPVSLDGRTWLVSSARIDDRKNLLAKLGLSKTLDLSTTPDAELILHAYRAWGEAALDHLLGDFSFVLWDAERKQLFCARDRFGVRQLYYAHQGSSFLFSNSLHCLLQHPQISKELNDQAMGDFLLFGDHTWMDKSVTAFAQVQNLPAAHELVLKAGRVSIQQYWDLPRDNQLLFYRQKEEYVEHFQSLFEQAVADRIRTSKLVISMSGGMDSSVIAATVCKLQKENIIKPLDVNAVTAVYDRIHPCEERHYTELVAQHLGIPVHFVVGDDYPVLDPAIATTRPLELETPAYWLAIKQKISEHGRVVLTGASADNLLECSPAYATFKEGNPVRLLLDILRMKKCYGRFPALGTGLMARLKGVKSGVRNRLVSPYPYPTFLNPEFEQRMDLPARWAAWLDWQPSDLHPRHPSAHNSLLGPDWNTDDLCMEPSFTLAEERDPFLDLRLAEFIFSIPSIPWLFQKHVLREAMQQQLPEAIIKRPKTPIGDITESLMKQKSSAWINDWTGTSQLSQYVCRDQVAKIVLEPWDGAGAYVNLRPLLLNKWLQQVL